MRTASPETLRALRRAIGGGSSVLRGIDMIEFNGAMLKPVCGIYEIKNTNTGQCYIGQSKTIIARWASHFNQLGEGRHNLRALQRDWNEHGPEAFTATIVKTVDNVADLLVEEAVIARQYINNGIKLYNAAIDGWVNEEELAFRLARAREVAAQEALVLQRKRAIEHETRNLDNGDRGNAGAVRTTRGVQVRGRVSGDSTGSSVEGAERGLCEPQAGLFVGKQGIDTEAGAERPAPASVDEDGQRGESDSDDTKVFPIFDDYAAEVLSAHLPKDKREKYLQDLIADTKDVTGGGVIDIGLFILAAYSPEDVAEIREMLDPSVMQFFLDPEKHAAEIEFFDNVEATYPGGLAAWTMDKIREEKRQS